MTAPADKGLQAERTALSWRRTALAVVIGSLLGLRVLPAHLGPIAYVGCVAGLLWSVDLAWISSRRRRQADGRVRTGDPRVDPGAAVCRTAFITLVLAVVSLVAVVVMGAS